MAKTKANELEKACRIALWEVDGIGIAHYQRLLTFFGSGVEAWNGKEELLIQELGEGIYTKLRDKQKQTDPKTHLNALEKMGIDVLVQGIDEDYPKLLASVEKSPPVLYVKGTIKKSDEQSLTVIGTRKPTSYGVSVTQSFVADLVEGGMTIVSGLARGIDGLAHRAALENGGRTLAVLGGGIDQVFPSEHEGLAEQITKSGAVISMFGPGKPSLPGNFVARNRVVSGLGRGVLVVEGAAKSGTRITSEYAMEQGRPVFAVPGPVTSDMSAAPTNLIQEGADLVTNANDILKALGADGKKKGSGKKVKLTDPVQKKIWKVLESGEMGTDEVVRRVKLDVDEVGVALTMMEMEGVITQNQGKYYRNV